MGKTRSPRGTESGGGAAEGKAGGVGTEAPVPPAGVSDSSTVEIWHWTDVFVTPWQSIHADQDRERNMLSAWHLKSGKLLQLGHDAAEDRKGPKGTSAEPPWFVVIT